MQLLVITSSGSEHNAEVNIDNVADNYNTYLLLFAKLFYVKVITSTQKCSKQLVKICFYAIVSWNVFINYESCIVID